MISEVVLATANAHKIEEMTAILAPSGIRLLTGRDFPNAPEPEETGTTYEENAQIKALAWARALGRAALADDSGLEVEALGGRPGVYSSRYAPTSPERIARLLGELEGIEMTRRGARFVCAAVIAWPDGRLLLRRGECAGLIALAPSGINGFGYDPIFYVNGCGGLTMAELPSAEKNSLSHRARALAQILEDLKTIP